MSVNTSNSLSLTMNSAEGIDNSGKSCRSIVFKNIPSNYTSPTLSCSFTRLQHVRQTDGDFVGLYRVGYQNIDQHIQKIQVSRSRIMPLTFNVNSLLLDQDQLYQFLYVGCYNDILGVSSPFKLRRNVRNVEGNDETIRHELSEDFNYRLNQSIRTEGDRLRERIESLEQELEEERALNASNQELSERTLKEEKDRNATLEGRITELEGASEQVNTVLQRKDSEISTMKQEMEALNCKLKKAEEELMDKRCLVLAFESKIKKLSHDLSEKARELQEIDRGSNAITIRASSGGTSQAHSVDENRIAPCSTLDSDRQVLYHKGGEEIPRLLPNMNFIEEHFLNTLKDNICSVCDSSFEPEEEELTILSHIKNHYNL